MGNYVDMACRDPSLPIAVTFNQNITICRMLSSGRIMRTISMIRYRMRMRAIAIVANSYIRGPMRKHEYADHQNHQ